VIPSAASYSIPKGRTSNGQINQLLAHAERERKARERREAGLSEAPTVKALSGTVLCFGQCPCGEIMVRRGTRGEWAHYATEGGLPKWLDADFVYGSGSGY
jgi:hypothetical protein